MHYGLNVWSQRSVNVVLGWPSVPMVFSVCPWRGFVMERAGNVQMAQMRI